MDIFTRFTETLTSEDKEILDHVRSYMEWRAGSPSEFRPRVDDDVHLRTYLLELKLCGTGAASQRKHMASIRRFYTWAKSNGLIKNTPDYYFSIERPSLTHEQIRTREEIFTGTFEQREVSRLKVLNTFSDGLNRAYDIQTTLQLSLEALVSTLALKTAWVYLLPKTGSPLHSGPHPSPHDFELAAACGLPPGLEHDQRFFLCKPDDCHCQMMLRAGQMRRAVNVVECTRLEESSEADGDNQGLLFHASVPLIVAGQPLGMINVATKEWQFMTSADLQLLSTIGAQVSVALERCYLYELTNRQRDRMENELNLAHAVQTGLLPQELPQITGFSFAAEWRSALEMAGDFYDVFELPDDRWGIVVADVSDKGAPAAMYMAMTRSLIRVQAQISSDPAETLLQVDQQLNAYSDSGMFVSVFYGVLDAASSSLVYASGGHDPPLLRSAAGQIQYLFPTGPLIGILDNIKITNAFHAFSPGDTLTVYTDGVIDALNHRDEEYGIDRLEGIVKGSPTSNAAVQLEYLKNDLEAFISGAPSFDDITCLILTRDGL